MRKTISVISFVVLLILSASTTFAGETVAFRSAKPIWLKDREKEMNLLVGFRAVFDAPADRKATVQVAAATIYRAWINGEFLGAGPARGPHDYYRVDQWDISSKLKPGKNIVAIEVAGYNANSYALLDQPSFLQAEVLSGDTVLASTSGDGQIFTARLLDERVQKVERYSFQRLFSEMYRLKPNFDRWRCDVTAADVAAETAVGPEKMLLPRRVWYSDSTRHPPVKQISKGRVEPAEMPKKPWEGWWNSSIGSPQLKGFPEKELSVILSHEAQRLRSIRTAALDAPYAAGQPIQLAAHEYQILDMGVNQTGFLGAKVTCTSKTRFWFVFDEVLSGDDVDFKRMDCVNIVSYDLEPGVYQLESIEPYTLRYLKLLCMEGSCSIEDVYQREFAHPPVQARFVSSDERLNRIFAAGVQTYRQNAFDIFMDCPSRERAGWLADSFFTARAGGDLDGNTLIERNFLENFLLPKKFKEIPEGMLPPCYPSDHHGGGYIPNWALWFVVELEEYKNRGGDPATVEAMRPRVLKLFDFFKKFENKDGLLEKLQSWIFVEWSKANEFVQDVNYPTNMLYAGALSAAAQMYNMPELAAKAEQIRDTIRRQSFDGKFFVDNAVRNKDGKLEATHNRTEICQYYAFFFKIATLQSHAELWQTLRDQFGPKRKKTGAFADICEANLLHGIVLRLELLSQAGRSEQIHDESIAYLLYMADRTGTLWEGVDAGASCNHGFSSHIVHVLYCDILGLHEVDRLHHKIALQFGDAKLDRCEGSVPTPDGPITLQWKKVDGRIEYHLEHPAGYEVTITNQSGLELSAK
jgi:alpha-L-rhamnosidase